MDVHWASAKKKAQANSVLVSAGVEALVHKAAERPRFTAGVPTYAPCVIEIFDFSETGTISETLYFQHSIFRPFSCFTGSKVWILSRKSDS